MTPVVKLVLFVPIMLKVAAVVELGPFTLPVNVKPPELALLIVLDASTLITRVELNAVVPVIDKVPPFRSMTLLALPRFVVSATDKVPAEIVVLPLYVFIPEITHVPEPTLVKLVVPAPFSNI